MTPKQLKSLEATLSLLRKHAKAMKAMGASGISMSVGEVSFDVAFKLVEKAEASGGIGFMLDRPAEEYDDED
jgi:hypothetical protein